MTVIAPLPRSADFERALATPPLARTPRFALHRAPVAEEQASEELSTGPTPLHAPSVDDRLPPGCRAGIVVPKRLARRAVTRHLVKRLARAALAGHERALGGGDWVVRLRAPIDPARFPSARSELLRASLSAELARLLASAASGVRAPRTR